MGFISDFKEFAFKGNLIDMAVGIVMGTAVGAIVKSFLDNIITPLIAMVAGVPDMTGMKFDIGPGTPKIDAVTGDPIVNAAGEAVMEKSAILYGTFMQNVIDFVILALVIFVALKVASKMMKTAADDAPPSDDVVLLTEIRDLLSKQ